MLNKKAEAYFTVEAAMILTLVTGVIVLLIYMMFFQYDRCLSDQDMGALALKGCSVQASSKEELLRQLEEYASQNNMDKYIAWQQSKINISLKGNIVRIEQEGELCFPFTDMSPGSQDKRWKTESIYENRRISPIVFLRTYRRISGGK